ncbi:MAG: S-layer homology domain-containing protein [Oscillospiraceae bacterium]|jgi:hypothetical protein|nr:S-layer homology domain-containing protein [Oscillospiraceae bacterium]
MKTRKALSLLVVLAMLISLVSVPAIAAYEAPKGYDVYELGPTDPDVTGGWATDGALNQMGWLIDESNIEYFRAAEYLVLDFDLALMKRLNANGMGGMQVILNEPDMKGSPTDWQASTITPDWTNWSAIETSSSVNADVTIDGDTLTFVIALADLKSYELFLELDTFEIQAQFQPVRVVKFGYLVGKFGGDGGDGGENGNGGNGTESGSGEAGMANFLANMREYDDRFTDLGWASSDGMRDWIKTMFSYNIMDGNTATTFAPSRNVTYAELITTAAKMHAIYNGKFDQFNGAAFPDDFVAYAEANGIIEAGAYDDLLGNAEFATRAAMVKIWAKILPAKEFDRTLNTFVSVSDVSEDDDEIIMFYEAGIVTGAASGGFGTDGNVTREQVAVMLARIADPKNRAEGRTYETEGGDGGDGGDADLSAGIYVWDALEGSNAWSGVNIVLGSDASVWPFSECEDGIVAFVPEKDAAYKLTFNATIGDWCPGLRVRWIAGNDNGGYTSADGAIANDHQVEPDEIATVIPAYFRGAELGDLESGETYTCVVDFVMDGSAEADGLIGSLAIRGGSGSNDFSINWIQIEDEDGNVLCRWDVGVNSRQD